MTLRPLTTLADADAILHVMIATWGNHQLLPREMIVALADSGNVPLGAFDEPETLIGYCLGWVAVDPLDGPHLHSHMLAALPASRHRGVGYALKLGQRAQCLDQGIRLMRWTFDPLLSRNAWLNLGKLGAVGDRFHRNHYGEMGDTLNAGERSDRVVVRWDLDREPGPHGVSEQAPSIAIPQDYSELRERDPEAAAAWRERVAVAFERHIADGMVAVRFERPGMTYRFGSLGEGAAA